jgi:RHS repeat-associated protein
VSGFGYDGMGNVTNDGSRTYTYDAEGRAITANGVNVIYDALGRAVDMGSAGQIVYDASGNKFAYMNGQTVQKYMVPLAAGLQAVYNASGLQYYRHVDWLGSSRLQPDTSGYLYGGRAYAPFGESYAETGTADRSFTGQTQDMMPGSTGIYDFLFRQHSAAQGRWLAPDPAGLAAVDLTNPQTWNRYAYVGNNPLSRTDPKGLRPITYEEPSVPMSVPWYYKSQLQGDLYGATLDGGYVSSDLVGSGLFGSSDSTVLCPQCKLGQSVGMDNQIYNSGDLENGVHEYNGKLYSSANYQALLKQVYASQISSQCGTVGGSLSSDAPSGMGAAVTSCDALYIEGGHANFSIDCGTWMGGNCAGRFVGGLHIEGNPTLGFWGHNDTASPYLGASFNWGTFNPWKLVVHGVVDVAGGNTAVYVFSH